ncbi:MerR family transcriptional regulator [soil metagenome]
MRRIYRVGEFAELTMVSVRTLHHYDQIGLLQPAAHSEGGHRLYSEEDLLRLQQILTLRFLGFALKEIGELLDRPDFDLVASMQIQRRVLRDRISELEQAESALGRLVDRRQETGQWDWDLVVKASSTVQGRREEKGKSMEKYFTPAQMRQFDELGKQVGSDVIQSIEQRWTELMAEVQANQNLDPATSEARELADRWNALTEETMAHYDDSHPELKQAISENYEQNRFAGLEGAPDPDMFAFIQKVNEAREG